MKIITRAMIGISTALAMATSVAAGPQYVDETGYAASGYDVVAYFDMHQNSVGSEQPAPLPGQASIVAEYNGAPFAFATEENRARFLENPAAFAPQYDGHCAYGVAKGGKVPGNPTLWRIVDDKLYVNITPVVAGFWNEDIPGNITKANSNWPKIEDKPASTNTIPKWSSSAPVQ